MKNQFKVEFNGSDELDYLLSGFTGTRNVKRLPGDPFFRNISDLARFRVPTSSGVINRLFIRMTILGDDRPQKITVRVNRLEAGACSLTRREWEEHPFTLPPSACNGEPALIELSCSTYYKNPWEAGCLSIAGFRTEAEGAYPAPAPERRVTELSTYWGDLHLHSNLSECANPAKNPYGSDGGSIEAILRNEREKEKTDFAAITDHIDHLIDPAAWPSHLAEIEKGNQPGRFITLPAYEWTSSHAHGHRNVYYRAPDSRTFDHIQSAADSPKKLWNKFRELGLKAFTIPHHPNRIDFPMNWTDRDDVFQPLVEIYSQWGNSEAYGAPLTETIRTVPGLSVQDALTRGHRLGFVGGSDSHIFGLKAHTFDTPHNRTNRGLTAILAPDLTRESLFDALSARRCYATTGARIKVDFTINGHPMGSEVSRNFYNFQKEFPLCLMARVESDAPLLKAEIIHNGRVLYTYDHCLDNLAQFAYYFHRDHPECSDFHLGKKTPPQYAIGRKDHMSFYDMYFYLRVTRVDRHMAWTSPIFFSFIRD